jgi:uncharacterized protein YegP (UPF0339 family)
VERHVTAIVDRVRVYQDAKGEYRWQALARNNQVIADSGEGYVDQSWATEAATRSFPDARLLIDVPRVSQ